MAQVRPHCITTKHYCRYVSVVSEFQFAGMNCEPLVKTLVGIFQVSIDHLVLSSRPDRIMF
jgi:hypothetical protein